MLKYSNLSMTIEHVENDSPSQRVYLQKIGFKKKVEQVEEQKLGSKAYLQKVKVEHIEEKSTSDIQVETVDEIYNERFQKYLNYYWIQKSIVQNVASRSFNSVRDQINHINHPHCMHSNKRC
jgi:hypothetical protein